MPVPRPIKKPVTALRIFGYSVLAAAVLSFTLYGLHTGEKFLIVDPRFAMNGAGGIDDAPTLLVAGAHHASHRAVEAVFSADSSRSVYMIPLADRRNSLRAVDWVKDATVSRLWPNRVLVQVSERTPVAFIPQGKAGFGLIDEDGVILPPVHDRFKLPVLKGIAASDLLSDRRDRVHRMMRLLAELGDASQKLSEIDVSDRDDIKVTQPFESRMLTLLLGDRSFAKRYDNFQRHFEEIHRKLPGANTLDLRLEDRITVVE